MEKSDLRTGVLDDRFDDEVGLGEPPELRHGDNASEQGVHLRGAHPAFFDRSPEALSDRLESERDLLLCDVPNEDLVTELGEDLGDAAAHGSGPDDADGANLRHADLMFLPSRKYGCIRAPIQRHGCGEPQTCGRRAPSREPPHGHGYAVSAAQAQGGDAASRAPALERMQQRR